MSDLETNFLSVPIEIPVGDFSIGYTSINEIVIITTKWGKKGAIMLALKMNDFAIFQTTGSGQL